MSNTTDTAPNADLAKGRSHFTAGSKLSGNLQVPGLVELLGHVDGKVSADSIVVEEGGSVDGELHAANVAVKGRFEGKIFGGVVNLHSSAKVFGEILYETLCIENGAEVNTTCAVKKRA